MTWSDAQHLLSKVGQEEMIVEFNPLKPSGNYMYHLL
jgi:hypothetical protein